MPNAPSNRIEITMQKGMRFDAINSRGVEIIMDAGSEHGGLESAANPMELLLAGLGGCTGMDVISILRKKRQHINSYRVEVEGERATEYPKVFTTIRIRHVIEGTDISEEAVRRAIELSEVKYCPAFAMLSQAATISSTFEVHPGTPAD